MHGFRISGLDIAAFTVVVASVKLGLYAVAAELLSQRYGMKLSRWAVAACRFTLGVLGIVVLYLVFVGLEELASMRLGNPLLLLLPHATLINFLAWMTTLLIFCEKPVVNRRRCFLYSIALVCYSYATDIIALVIVSRC